MPRLPAGQTTICTTGSLSLLFFSLSLLHNKSDTHKDEAVKNKCSNWTNQFRCSQVIKCCSQGKGTAGALPMRQIYHTSLFPTLCWKRKDKKNPATACCSLPQMPKAAGAWYVTIQWLKYVTRGHFLCHNKCEQSLDSFQIFCLATSGSNTR